MDLVRDIRSIANKINNPSSSKSNVAPQTANSHQGLASLIVMIAVLTIIILFCCFAAPGIRGLCKRYVFRSCPYDDPERDNVYTRRYGYAREELKTVIAEERRKSLKLAPQHQNQEPQQ